MIHSHDVRDARTEDPSHDDSTGKTVLVTAAAQGIGKASALAFARAGAKVHRHRHQRRSAGANSTGKANVTTRKLDVLDEAPSRRPSPRSAAIDVLFNCAGFVHAGSILEMKDADLDFAFDLNVKSMVRTIRAVLPGMIERGDGAIVNMASVAGSIKGVPNRFAYGVTKAAVVGLTKAVAADYVGQGHSLQRICPGTVESPSLRSHAGAGRLRDGPRRLHRAPADGPARHAGGDRRPRRLSGRRHLHDAARPTLSTAAGRSDRSREERHEACSFWRSRARAAGVDRRSRARSATCRAMCSTLPASELDPDALAALAKVDPRKPAAGRRRTRASALALPAPASSSASGSTIPTMPPRPAPRCRPSRSSS